MDQNRDLVLAWLKRQLHLLNRERQAEHEQSHLLVSKAPPRLLERHGLALLNLGVSSVSSAKHPGRRSAPRTTGGGNLGQQTVLVELHRPEAWHSDVQLPPHSFRTGDLCAIQDHGAGGVKSSSSADNAIDGFEGVVYSTQQDRITVAVSARSAAVPGKQKGSAKQGRRAGRNALELPERCRLVKIANDSTFDRMEQTIERLASILGFGPDELAPAPAPTKNENKFGSERPDQASVSEQKVEGTESNVDAADDALKTAESSAVGESGPNAQASAAEGESATAEDPEKDGSDSEGDGEEDSEAEIQDADSASDSASDTETTTAEDTQHLPASKPIPDLVLALLGLSTPSFLSPLPSKPTLPVPPINSRLNESQLGAIQFALQSHPFVAIHGPPGTGKTTTLVELIAQVVLAPKQDPKDSPTLGTASTNVHRKRVLVCAASNLAVDNILERLVVPHPATVATDLEHDTATRLRAAGISIVRLGHPARVTPALVERTLDRLASPYERDGAANKVDGVDRTEAEMIRDVTGEMTRVRDQLAAREPPKGANAGGASNARARSKKPAPKDDQATGRPVLRGFARKEAWNSLRALRKEHESRTRRLMKGVLSRADVVLCTCHGAGSRILERAFDKQAAKDQAAFDVVIVDEACQALEPVVWVPILRALERTADVKLVLAGDHLQLPPTVKDPEAGRIRKAREAKALKLKQKEAKRKEKTKLEAPSPDTEPSGEEEEGSEESEVLDDDLEDMTLSDVEQGPTSSGDEHEDEPEAAAADSPSGSSALVPHPVQRPLRPPRTLETTMFSRLLGMYGPTCKVLLEKQYRMNVELQDFPNSELYEGRLHAWSGCANSRLSDLDNFKRETGAAKNDEEPDSAPLVFIDTAGTDMLESSPDGQTASSGAATAMGMESKSNTNEAALVVAHVKRLVAAGVDVSQIVVLSPYSAQVALISEMLSACQDAEAPASADSGTIPSNAAAAAEESGSSKAKGKRPKQKQARRKGAQRVQDDDDDDDGPATGKVPASVKMSVSLGQVEVGTIDGMQGREKEAVVLSLVRSNREREVGFLAEKRRLNVAMTRAKRHLCVVGDSETVGRGGTGYLSDWMRHLAEHALVVTPDDLL
ncbi:hypothetical protein OC845_003618 [Tilletia horrida]|nr:hypothetical protein OC845_003618 [Tilletia horrida]